MHQGKQRLGLLAAHRLLIAKAHKMIDVKLLPIPIDLAAGLVNLRIQVYRPNGNHRHKTRGKMPVFAQACGKEAQHAFKSRQGGISL